jgi:hypothetical protein
MRYPGTVLRVSSTVAPEQATASTKGGPLRGQQSTCWAADLGHQFAGDYLLTVRGMGDELKGWLHAVKQGLSDRQAS